MTREEKCLLAIEKEYTYNPETGKIYSRFGYKRPAWDERGRPPFWNELL